MTVYNFEIVETLSRVIEIDAESYDEAYHELRRRYREEEIVLDAEDYMDTEYLDYEYS